MNGVEFDNEEKASLVPARIDRALGHASLANNLF